MGATSQPTAMKSTSRCPSHDAGEAVWWTMMPTGPPL